MRSSRSPPEQLTWLNLQSPACCFYSPTTSYTSPPPLVIVQTTTNCHNLLSKMTHTKLEASQRTHCLGQRIYSVTYSKIEEETTVFDKTLYIVNIYTIWYVCLWIYWVFFEIEMNFSFGYYGNCHPTHLFYETFETRGLSDKNTHTQSVSTQTRRNNKQTASGTTATTTTTVKQVTTIHSVIYNLKLFDLRGVRKWVMSRARTPCKWVT